MSIKINTKYEILSPNGFVNFHSIRMIKKESYCVLLLSNNTNITCSILHPFIIDERLILAYLLRIGMKLDSKLCDIFIQNINHIKLLCDLFDIMLVDNDNVFYVNDIVSHNCAFLSSGNTVIDGLLIKLIQLKYESDPLYKRSDGLWVWQLPVSDLEYQLEYFISADVGRGDSEDPSAFHIFNRRTLLQVALFSSIINTDKYAKTLVNVAQWYNNAILIVENATVGWAVLQLIIRLGYENLYYDTTNPAYADQLRIQGRKLLDANGKQRLIPGFTTSPKTRPLIIDKLVKMFLSQSVIIHSKRTYAQLYTFIWSNGKPQAMSKYHDDLVMAMAIALWVRDTGLAAHLNSRIREETKLALFNSSINTSNIIPKTEQDQKLKLMNLEYNVMNLSFNLTELLDPRYRIARDKLLFMKNNK